jgi:serine/threonine-protein kinase
VNPEPDVVLGGRYELIRRIAVGGMGEVWEATDTLLGRQVAVKIMKEEFRTAPTFLARFRAEARHAGRLNHPGIAAVYDYGETDAAAFLVMELVSGRPLSELMVQQPALSAPAKLSILAQAADALQAAHEAGVVHRDVKPGNLMVRPDGTVKVTDFGIARALTSAPLTDHGQMIGTPAYVSPEQATGESVTGSSDIYSLGVVAYELFAGRPPFDRDTPLAVTLAHVEDLPPPLPDTVPTPLRELIESTLAKDPKMRPPSAARLATQLRHEMAAVEAAPARVLPVQPVIRPLEHAVPSRVAPLAVRSGSGPSVYIAVATFLVLLVLGATILATTRSSRETIPIPTQSSLPTEPPPTEPPPTGPPPTQPSPTQPSPTQPSPTQPSPTQPPPTQPPPTQPPPTQPPPTQPPPTQPPPTQPPPTEPPPTQPAPVVPPSTAATIAPRPAGEDPIAEPEAVAFLVGYYERVAAGDYEATWESLSPEFRDDRDLSFDDYVAYWERTTIELRNLRFVPGPGDDQVRVRFDARYDTGARVIDETDEITLRRSDDGTLIIIEQRTV